MGNGQHAEFEIGLAQISFCDETFPVRVIFGPDGCEPILGVMALKSAGFMVDPKNQTLTQLKVFPLKKVAAEMRQDRIFTKHPLFSIVSPKSAEISRIAVLIIAKTPRLSGWTKEIHRAGST